jgi:transcriptional regulator with XRE-family HTH domain
MTSPGQNNAIGTRLRAARDRRHWNREALAFHSGVSWSAIAQIEAGRRTNLRPSTLAALAQALGVTIDYLVSGSAARPPMLDHRALLYDSEVAFLDGVSPFIAEAIAGSQPVLIVTTVANVGLVRAQLGSQAGQLEFADRSSLYDTPAGALSGYREFLEAKIETGAQWVRILGEPLWTARTDTEVRLWARYESLLNLVFSRAPVSLLCPYDQRAVDPQILQHALATHPLTQERGELAPNSDYADPGGFVLEP